MSVENGLDELWVGVKGQSNLVIARTPRNSFRASLADLHLGGRALEGLGSLYSLPTPTKLRMPMMCTAGVRLWGISSIVERETTQIAS